jgi:hypothetical protein
MPESRQSDPVITIVDDDPSLREGQESLMLRMADKLGIRSRKTLGAAINGVRFPEHGGRSSSAPDNVAKGRTRKLAVR